MTRAKSHHLIRYPDITVSKNDAYMQIFTSDSYPITIKLKPHERAGETHEKVLFRGVLSHVAKMLGIAFNFGGAGTDGFSTSIVGTLPYVQIVQLRLVSTGTWEVKLFM